MLTTQEIEQFHRDGFVVVRNVLGADVLGRVRRAIDELTERSRALPNGDAFFEVESDHSARQPRLRRMSHPVCLAAIFWDVATSAAVLDCVESLVGPDIKFHHSKVNMKAERGGAQIGWHQDFAFFPHTNFDVVGCGIAIDDSTRDNGCLLVVPGTHEIGILSHRDEAGEFVGAITGADAGRFEPRAAVPVELRAGDMSIHDARVVHGSLANRSGQARRLLIYEYAACDAIQLDRRPPANEYSERVVRGRAATHARLAGAIRLPLRGEVIPGASIFERQQRAAPAAMSV